jgi:hypothetical protein
MLDFLREGTCHFFAEVPRHAVLAEVKACLFKSYRGSNSLGAVKLEGLCLVAGADHRFLGGPADAVGKEVDVRNIANIKQLLTLAPIPGFLLL